MANLRTKVLEAWAALAGLAVLVIGVTFLFARRAARRIAQPFEQLTAAARDLGTGAFDVALPRWGITEADTAGAALQHTGRELGQLITQERDFVRHASHQLRTPLAGLIVQLERLANASAPQAAAALDSAHQLERTLDDLLLIRSPAGGERCQPGVIAAEVVQRWQASTSRPIRIRDVEVEAVHMPGAALRQALDVLVDNAVRHGGGEVTVTVEPLGASVVVEVADEGEGFPVGSTPGTGLRLATGLMQRFGGELLIRRRSPRPRVALLLPQDSSSSSR